MVQAAGVRRSSAAASRGPLKIAIVGSGPAGMYTARTLLRKVADVEVDVIEMLPTPYGLVRYGVAPDHADTKNVTAEFSQILSAPNCRFHGNVTVDKDVSVQELLRLYHGVVLAYGADGDRRLGISGEDLVGSYSARDLVNWYNGHPAYADFSPDLTRGEDAVIVGNGNVAVDVARILLKPLEALKSTDIADHALDALASSSISRVHIVGRRGAAQAAFTIAELREMVTLQGINVVMQPQELELDVVDEEQMAKKRPLKRMIGLLRDAMAQGRDAAVTRELHLRFLLTPDLVHPAPRAPSHVGAVTFEANKLEGAAEARRAVGTGERETISCSLLMRSVGYRSHALHGVPFDHQRHTVPQAGGAVKSDEGLVPGLYVAGWLKRGPTGIIGTNISDAQQTALAVIMDWEGHALAGPREGGGGLSALLRSRHVRRITALDWQRIDEAEVARGAAQGRPRRKFVTIEEMLAVVG